MPDVHARFSPSASDRLIHCPPSLRLGEEYGPKDTSSEYSKEGTEAHSLGEYLLRCAVGEIMEDPRPGMQYYTEEMQTCAESYRDYVLEIRDRLLQETDDTFIGIEQQVSFDEYVKGAFGTSDACVIGAEKMYVIDLKYGKGVPVSAAGDGTGNSQLKCYALGLYLAFSPVWDIEEITLVVYQPRIGNFDQYTLSVDDLIYWAEHVLKPAGALALAGEGDLSTGEWCRFCKAKAVCRKRAEENLSLAMYDFARPPVLEEDEINMILSCVDDLVSWANDIKTYATEKALSGYIWDDWKLVEGRSIRKYTNEKDVAAAVAKAGYNPYQERLLSIGEMEALLGKAQFKELLGNLITKPPGKPTLVPRSDKRTEITTIQMDFNEED